MRVGCVLGGARFGGIAGAWRRRVNSSIPTDSQVGFHLCHAVIRTGRNRGSDDGRQLEFSRSGFRFRLRSVICRVCFRRKRITTQFFFLSFLFAL
jgi:hypothetical protein